MKSVKGVIALLTYNHLQVRLQSYRVYNLLVSAQAQVYH